MNLRVLRVDGDADRTIGLLLGDNRFLDIPPFFHAH